MYIIKSISQGDADAGQEVRETKKRKRDERSNSSENYEEASSSFSSSEEEEEERPVRKRAKAKAKGVKAMQGNLMTKNAFLEDAKAFDCRIGDFEFQLEPRLFSTGSCGWCVCSILIKLLFLIL